MFKFKLCFLSLRFVLNYVFLCVVSMWNYVIKNNIPSTYYYVKNYVKLCDKFEFYMSKLAFEK